MRRPLDRELVRRGLVASIDDVAALLAHNRVTVNGAIAQRGAHQVAADDAVEVLAPPPRFVSRAGDKLDGALDRFGIDVVGLRGIDAGSSTGGFTDCLLQRGVDSVVAVDVGTNQLHERLRGDARVRSIEQTNIKAVDPAEIGAPFDLLVADLSFVSLASVFAAFATLVGESSTVVSLVKPQFEATKAEADRGRGVITDPDIWSRVLTEVRDSGMSHHLVMMDLMPSPITGTRGNVEFVARLGLARRAVNSTVDRAVGEPAALSDAALATVVEEARRRTAKDDR